MSKAVVVDDLHKSYGSVDAVRGVSFEIAEGEVFALLGPNGAGKTTIVEILEGFRSRTRGSVQVLGSDPVQGGRALRERVGIVLQTCGIDPFFSVAETLRATARVYPHPRPIDEVIDLVGLTEQAGARVMRLSGGQQRRLDLALALVGDPELVFLDEPTTGFDPSARRASWDLIEGLCRLGKTVLLTTHYMEEAQRLADRIVVISQGVIVAEGTPETIGGRDSAAAVVRFALPGSAALDDLPVEGAVLDDDGIVSIRTDAPTRLLHDLTTWALAHGGELVGLEVQRPSLEDVYLDLTSTAEGAGTE
jgi:ABC-2 type transport system ATP-binding protein